MSKRKLVNDADFFFALPSGLKRKADRIATRQGISTAAFVRVAIRRLLDDVKDGRETISFGEGPGAVR